MYNELLKHSKKLLRKDGPVKHNWGSILNKYNISILDLGSNIFFLYTLATVPLIILRFVYI